MKGGFRGHSDLIPARVKTEAMKGGFRRHSDLESIAVCVTI